MTLEWYHYLLGVFGGLFAGFINTLAGNGSAVTLTILIFFGLPADVANGTNRIGVLAQSLVAAGSFKKKGHLQIQHNWWNIIPVLLGAILGVIVAIYIEVSLLKSIIGFLMLFLLVIVIIQPKKWISQNPFIRELPKWVLVPVFFLVGFYGGFIQMGMGVIYLLTMVLLARFSLIHSNSIKAFVVFLYTIFVLGIFIYSGLVDWKLGILLTVGQVIGAWIAAQHAIYHSKAEIWIRWLLILVILVSIFRIFNIFNYFQQFLSNMQGSL